jgi:hypothetical protein
MNKSESLDYARAAAWMAFCKGMAVMGNRDAGEHRATFDSWWLSYGVIDANLMFQDLELALDTRDRLAHDMSMLHSCIEGNTAEEMRDNINALRAIRAARESVVKHYPSGMGNESRRLHREYNALVEAQRNGEKNAAEVVRLTDECNAKGIILVPGGENL